MCSSKILLQLRHVLHGQFIRQMNAAAYLSSLGWRGKGFSLDQSGRGLTKPLLISPKADLAGLGIAKHDYGNQWWLDTLDKQLKGIRTELDVGDDGAKPLGGGESPRSLNSTSSLYTSFVKAETLTSTIVMESSSTATVVAPAGALVQSAANGVVVDNASNAPAAQSETRSRKRKHEDDTSATVTKKKKKREKLLEHFGERTAPGDSQHREHKERQATDVGENVEVNGTGRAQSEKKENKKNKKQKIPVQGSEDPEDSLAGKDVQVDTNNKRAKTVDEHIEGYGRLVTTGEQPKRKDRKSKLVDDVINSKPSLNPEVEFHGETTKSSGLTVEVNVMKTGAELKQNSSDMARKDEAGGKKMKHKRKDGTAEGELTKAEGEDHSNHQKKKRVVDPAAATVPVTNGKSFNHVHKQALKGLEGSSSEAFATQPSSGADTNISQLDVHTAHSTSYVANVNPARVHLISSHVGNSPPVTEEVKSAKKKSLKAQKYEREKAKRVAKREAKGLAVVRINSSLHRPNETLSEGADDVTPPGERSQAAKEAQREARIVAVAEKQARRTLKEQMKAERRLARKMRRSEKKQKNHIEMQAKVSAKIKKQKQMRDQMLATERGLTVEAFLAERAEVDRIRRRKRNEEKAQELGMTLEAYLEQKENTELENGLKKEARKLGLTVEEYVNQPAQFSEVDINSDEEPGLKYGTRQHFGRSPIDKIWLKREAAETRRTADVPDTALPDGETSTRAANPSHDLTEDGFISLDVGEVDKAEGSHAVPFMVDTAGDPSLLISSAPKKRVKDLTKAERKARLEAMRARRAERALAKGGSALTKKERRKIRAQRKEALVIKIASDILAKKRGLLPAAGESSVASSKAAPLVDLKKQPMQEAKQARREARKVMRGMKKGRVPQNEILPGWEPRGFESKQKRKQMKDKQKAKYRGVVAAKD